MHSSDHQNRLNPACGPLSLATLLALSIFSGAVAAAGSSESGERKAVTCAACHGQDGNSLNPEWPSLAGQHEKYVVNSLQAYKDGKRSNVLMTGQALALNEQDMADLAAFYAAQTLAQRIADPALVTQGERLYRGGNRDSGVSACIACHGPTGRGNPAAAYPSLAGQHGTYTAGQLRAYASADRKSDAGQMMRNIAARMTEDEIIAVSSYIQGLR